MGKKSMSGRKLTFLLITIPIVALFFCFNTLPLIKGVIYSFTNFKGYGSYDWVGLRNYKDLFTDSPGEFRPDGHLYRGLHPFL